MEAVYEVIILEAMSILVRLIVAQVMEWWRTRQPIEALSLS